MKTVMKTMATALLMLTVAVSVNAQRGKDAPKFHLGLRGGFSLNFASDNSADESTDALFFPQGGIAADIKLGTIPLYLETGAYYMNKGYKMDWLYFYDDMFSGQKTRVFDNHFIGMPLLASYHIYIGEKFSIQPFAGFVGGYLTKSKDFEGAVRIGCGISFGRLYANFGYDIGVVNHDVVIREQVPYLGSFVVQGTEKFTNNSFFMTLGFNFIGKR